MAEELDDLIALSAKTNVQVLLTATENAKRAVLENPSQANLAALERASRMLESAMEAKNFADYKAVLIYAEERGRKVKKTKLFNDIQIGRLRKQADGSFKKRDVDRYFASLPMLATPDAVAERAQDRHKRKEEQEIRRIKAAADKDEFDLAVKMGKYVPRETVHLELAARAIALESGIKTAFEAKALELIEAVEGNPKKATALITALANIFDEALNGYSHELEIVVQFEPKPEESE